VTKARVASTVRPSVAVTVVLVPLIVVVPDWTPLMIAARAGATPTTPRTITTASRATRDRVELHMANVPPETADGDRQRKRPHENGGQPDDRAAQPPLPGGLETNVAPVALEGDGATEEGVGGHPVDVRQHVAAGHERVSVPVDETVHEQSVARIGVTDNVTNAQIPQCRFSQPHDVSVTEKRPHTSAARFELERPGAPQLISYKVREREQCRYQTLQSSGCREGEAYHRW
jgi:hypothetical protein